MNDDMIIDISNFDFSMLDDGIDNTPETTPAPKASFIGDEEPDEDELDWDAEEVEDEDEEDFEDDEDDEDFDNEEGINSLIDFSSKFDDIPDDLEFNIGGQTVTKQFIAETVKTRNDIKEAETEMRSYINNLRDKEDAINTAIQMSVTEVEGRLEYVNSLLKDPESMTPTDLQKVLVSKAALEKRYTELDGNIKKIRAAEAERREQTNVIKIKQTDMAMRGEPGWKGIESIREIANFAQERGVDSALLLEGMSPSLMKMMLNAKKFEEMQTTNKKRLRDSVKAPVKSIPSKPKSRASATTKGRANKTERRELLRRMKAGESTSDFFHLLDD